ncbi:MAG: protein adenylyltransferase SelO family protein, partial [Gammaproteobacteria bacterium]
MAANPQNPIALQHYRQLPDGMFQEVAPTPTRRPVLLELNKRLLAEYGVDEQWFFSDEALGVFSGNQVNSRIAPIAMAYAGHQFGHWVPQLGDGRAHMLGQMRCADGTIVDVQLKGSGRTRFSRGGDGRATLGSVVREYLISEAMAGLGIPTSRSLAIIETGEPVYRDEP